MKCLIVYDSKYGNTEKVAKAIAKGISSKVMHVSDANSEMLSGVKLFVIGSPTQGGRPTAAIQNFLDQIPQNRLTGVKTAVFDTRFSEKKVNPPLKLIIRIFGYAAPKMAETLKNKGADLLLSPEGFIVEGTEGPLAPGEILRAEKWLKL